MATRPPELFAQIDQGLLSQLRLIVQSDLDFAKLTDDQKKALTAAAILAGYKTNLELFLDLKLHPEKIGLPSLPPEKLETATINAQVLAANLEIYLADQDLKNQIDAQFKDRTQAERELIERLIRLRAIQIQAEVLAAQASAQTSQVLETIHEEVDPKSPPLPIINETISEVITAAASDANVTLTQTQIDDAVLTVSTAAFIGVANLADAQSRNEILQVVLSASPDYTSPTAVLYHEVSNSVTLTSAPDYTAATPTHTQIAPDVAVNFSEIHLPAAEIKPQQTQITLPEPITDRAEEVQARATRFATIVILNPKTDDIVAAVSGNITPIQSNQLVAALRADNLLPRAAPTKEGSTASRVIREIDKANPLPVPIELVSMGLTMRAVEEKIAAEPNSKTARFFHDPQNANVKKQLDIGFQRLENLGNDLGKEISPRIRLQAAQTGTLPPSLPRPTAPGPLSGVARGYQTLTNRISGFLPGRVGQVFNVVTHPFQSFQSYLGNFVGRRIVGQFKDWIAQKVVSKIANETLKKGAEFILKRGVQAGVKLLAEQGLKRGLQALAQAANVAPGAGLVLAAAIEVAFAVGGKILQAAGSAINGIFRTFTGEDFDARTAVAVPIAVMTGVGNLFGILGTATIAAGISGALILIFSVLLGIFLYMTVITMAPIISSIAQLESGTGPQQTAYGPVLPSYTGPILPGCPKIWPTPSGVVIQGPHGSFSHQLIEAIDIYIPVGTPVRSVTDGTVLESGWATSNPAYGNWVKIQSTLENGQKFTIIYGHLSQVNVAVGNNVQAGSTIALSGNSSSVASFANPHLHLEYVGTSYNSCPAGGVQIPDGCYGTNPETPGSCTINGKAITIY